MAVGNSFSSLLVDDVPSPKAEPLNKEKGEMSKARNILAAKGERTAFASPVKAKEVHRDAEQAAYWSQEDAALNKRRANEANAGAAFERQQGQDQALTAQYGTDDPTEAARRKASGLFDSDVRQLMQMDPEGTKAKFDRLVAEDTGAQALTGEDSGRTYSVGKGAHGEPYYTNLSRGELKEEQHTADTIRGERTAPRVTDLKRLDMRDSEGGAASESRDPARILYEGKLDQIRAVVGQPERENKRVSAIQAYASELQDKKAYPTANEALDKLHADRQSGKLGKMGVKVSEEAKLERAIAHFAKPYSELQMLMPDEQALYRPWDPPGADRAAPATVANPNGAMPPAELAEGLRANATSDHAQAITDSLPREQPRTFQYANGARPLSPTAARLKAKGNATKEAERKKRRDEFGFDYEPPSLGGMFSDLTR